MVWWCGGVVRDGVRCVVVWCGWEEGVDNFPPSVIHSQSVSGFNETFFLKYFQVSIHLFLLFVSVFCFLVYFRVRFRSILGAIQVLESVQTIYFKRLQASEALLP